MALGLLAVTAIPSPARAAAASPPLPAAAQAAVEAGRAADSQQDYLAAVGHFQRALAAAPNSAEVLFYLGVEEAKLPGRELRAIAWFASYLALRPDASNASAVRREITRLQQSYRQTLQQLLARLPAVIGAANRPDIGPRLRALAADYAAMGEFPSALQTVANLENFPKEQALAYADVARSQAEAGNRDEAQRLLRGALANLGRLNDADKDVVRSVVVDRQIEYRDFSGALTTAAALQDVDDRRHKLRSLVDHQIEAVDLLGALGSAEAMPASSDRDAAFYRIASARVSYGNRAEAERIVTTYNPKELKSLLVEIATYQAKQGNSADALATLARIEGSGKDYAAQSAVHLAIAKAHLARGATGDARRSLAVALTAAQAINDSESKDYAFLHLAVAQAELGDVPGALQVAGRIGNESRQISATSLIAEGQAKRGDFAEALKTVRVIGNSDIYHTRDYTLASIAEMQVERGDFAGARQTTSLIENQGAASTARGSIYRLQLAKGDIAGARQTIGTLDDKWSQAAVERTILEAQVKHGDAAPVWRKMLADADPEDADSLGAPLLLDLPGQLRGLAPSTDAEKNYYAFAKVFDRLWLSTQRVEQLVTAQMGKP
jgi:tetratricopeptide (TPR) repeat protein